jgi:hypothetical protein
MKALQSAREVRTVFFDIVFDIDKSVLLMARV